MHANIVCRCPLGSPKHTRRGQNSWRPAARLSKGWGRFFFFLGVKKGAAAVPVSFTQFPQDRCIWGHQKFKVGLLVFMAEISLWRPGLARLLCVCVSSSALSGPASRPGHPALIDCSFTTHQHSCAPAKQGWGKRRVIRTTGLPDVTCVTISRHKSRRNHRDGVRK